MSQKAKRVFIKVSSCVIFMTSVFLTDGHAMRGEKVTTGTREEGHLLPPVVWGANNQWQLQVGADQRVRWERRDNYDLTKRQADNDDLAFERTRVNMDLSYRSLWRIYAELADARQVGARTDVKQEAYWHLHQLFLETRLREGAAWSVRVGRQSLSFGEKRLLDYTSWGNLPALHDGVRLRYKTDSVDANFFVVQPTTYMRRHKPSPTTDEPHPLNHTWLYGTYTTLSWWKPHEVDFYVLGYSDRAKERTFPSTVKGEAGEFGTSSRYTLGSRLRGPIWKQPRKGALGYGLEAAWQWGNVAKDDVRAYMLHADLNYTWDKPWKPKLTLEGNLASGDRRFGEWTNNTFSPLFGTSHTPYGIIDFTRLQNLRELALLFSVQPTEKLKLQAEAHHYWLDSRTDGWYGGPKLRDKTGQSGRDLGDEISLVATYKLSRRVTLEGGVAHFFPGNFPRKFGRNDGANFAYLQYEIKF